MGRKGRAPIGPIVASTAAVHDSKVTEPQASYEWWHDLKEDDPITLEPLASLDVPPFGLDSDGTMHYFDPVALASYITRRAVFENPLNRKAISREDCARLDDHIRQYVPCCRQFHLANALDLKRAIQEKLASGSDRSAATMRREAAAALRGLFSYPSLQAAETLAAAQSAADQGWAVIDDDLQRHIESEAIAAMHAAAAAEAARPGGAAPEASPSNFPELSEEALLASERLSAAVMEGDGYARVAQAMADQAAREARARAAEEAARKAAAKEAASRLDAAKRAAKARALERQREQEILQTEAKAREADQRAEIRRRVDEEKREALRTSVVEATISAEARRAEEQLEASKRAEQERLEAEEEMSEKLRREEEDKRAAEEQKREKEAEKKRRQKEKKKLAKEQAAKAQAAADLEAAKRAASLRCALCGEGILGKNFFEVMGEKFCSTACARKKKAESAS